MAGVLILRNVTARPEFLNLQDVRRLHSFAGAMIFVGLFQYVVQQPLADLIIVGRYETEAVVGFYSVAAKIAAVAATAAVALNVVMVPIFSSLVTLGDTRRLQDQYQQASKWMAWGVIAAAIPILLFQRQILLIFGGDYTAAKRILQVLLFSWIAFGLLGINTPLLLATGFVRLELYLSAAACGLMVLLGVLLAQRFGAIGVACATAISTTLPAAVRRLVVGRIFGRMRLQMQNSQPHSACARDEREWPRGDSSSQLFAAALCQRLSHGAQIFVPATGPLSVFTSSNPEVKIVRFKRVLPNSVSRLLECLAPSLYFPNTEQTLVLGDLPLPRRPGQVVLVHQLHLLKPEISPLVSYSATFRISRWLFERHLRFVSRIIVQTPVMKEELERSYPAAAGRIEVVSLPPPHWLQRGERRAVTQQQPLSLFYPAAGYPHKNHRILMEMNRGMRRADILKEMVVTLESQRAR